MKGTNVWAWAARFLFLRFIVRDFKYSEDAVEDQKRELQEMDASEKELWVMIKW